MKKVWTSSPLAFKIGLVILTFLLIMAFLVTLFYRGPSITQYKYLWKESAHQLGTSARNDQIGGRTSSGCCCFPCAIPLSSA